MTTNPYRNGIIRGRPVILETPAEIVVKKAFYRAATLQVRDVFDLAVVARNDLPSLMAHRHVLLPKLDLLEQRMRGLQGRYFEKAPHKIDVLPAGEVILERAPEIVSRLLVALRNGR